MGPAKGKGDAQAVRVRLVLANLGDRERPQLHVELADGEGKCETVELSAEGEFQLASGLVGKGYRLEIRGAAGEGRRYDYDSFLERARKEPVYVLPEAAWVKLVYFNTCVTGSVRVCWPNYRVYDLVALAAKPDGFNLLKRYLPSPALELSRFNCSPVCRGKVEVFLRTCCCPVPDPVLVIDNICEIINCYEVEWPPKPWDPRGPRPPEPEPWRGPKFQRSIQKFLERSEAVEGGRAPEEILQLAFHYQALKAAPPSEQRAYIQLYPELRHLFCTCTTVKVAQTYLEEDGHFDACFYASPFLARGCSRRVLYRVTQLQESGWVVIYDGLAKGQSFALDAEAELTARSKADACDDPHEWGPVPFVILEHIGGTWADNLIHSTDQGGEAAGLPTFGGPLAGTDGLVNPAPPGPPPAVTAGPYEQPWATTLALSYQFHPGLAALGAKYYRTRLIRVGANGQPVTGPGAVNQTVTGDLSWRKYYNPPGPEDSGVMWVPLHNPVVNGVEGLYTIPFPDLVYPWLGIQYHANVDTTGVPNGRYLFVVDTFNAAGQRLVPTNSVEPPAAGEVAAEFRYRRLDGPIDAAFSNTSIVPHRALASLFLVDNVPTYADIEAIVHNAVASDANCQFLVGPATDSVRLQYSAYQTSGYQWYHQISFKQGLTGPITTLPASNANVFSGLSPALAFEDLLPGPDTKCAFATTLNVHTKHTNGGGRVQAFDRSDIAAFAVEITP